MRESGAKIYSVADGKTPIVIGSAPPEIFETLSKVRGVKRIEIARPIDSDLDISRSDSRIETLHVPPHGEGVTVRGEGAIVGIIDSGIDFTHPKFRNKDGSSRILYLWDQPEGSSAGHQVKLENKIQTGREYRKKDIDTALKSNSPLAKIPHLDHSGHGTHVAGIAAGNGREGLAYRGIALDADIIVVSTVAPSQTIGKSTDILLAYKYIIDRAGSQASIN